MISINRGLPVEEAKEVIDLAIKLKEEWNSSSGPHPEDDSNNQFNMFDQRLVGIELSGDPRVGDFNNFKEQLDRAK